MNIWKKIKAIFIRSAPVLPIEDDDFPTLRVEVEQQIEDLEESLSRSVSISVRSATAERLVSNSSYREI
jgi:hypothetical protein